MTPSDTSLSNVVVRVSSDRLSMLKACFRGNRASHATRKMGASEGGAGGDCARWAGAAFDEGNTGRRLS